MVKASCRSLPFRSIGNIHVRYDQDIVLRIQRLNFAAQRFQRFLAVNFKADYHVKTDRFLFGVGIKAVHLQRPVVRHDGLLDRVAHTGRFVVGGVEGINANARQYHAGLLKDVGLDPPRDAVHFVHAHGVRQLDMHGAVVLVRAVIEERHVISAEHVLLRADDLLELLRRFRVLALADYVVQRFDHHLDTGLDDKARDDHADVRFERNAPDEINYRRGEHRRRQYRVEQCVGARGLERAGADLFALLSDVEPEHELNGYRNGDYYERYRAVIRRFGMDDLFDRLDERRDARVKHERGDDHGA